MGTKNWACGEAAEDELDPKELQSPREGSACQVEGRMESYYEDVPNLGWDMPVLPAEAYIPCWELTVPSRDGEASQRAVNRAVPLERQTSQQGKGCEEAP